MDRTAPASPHEASDPVVLPQQRHRPPHSPRKSPGDPDVHEFCRIVARIVIRVLMDEGPRGDNDRENA